MEIPQNLTAKHRTVQTDNGTKKFREESHSNRAQKNLEFRPSLEGQAGGIFCCSDRTLHLKGEVVIFNSCAEQQLPGFAV